MRTMSYLRKHGPQGRGVPPQSPEVLHLQKGCPWLVVLLLKLLFPWPQGVGHGSRSVV